GRMRIGGAGHGQCAGFVLEAVPGFVLDRGARALLVHVGVEAAALNHEAVDDAVEDGAVVMAVLDVLDEVFGGLGRLVGEDFDHDLALVGLQFDHRIGSQCAQRSGRQRRKGDQMLSHGISGARPYGLGLKGKCLGCKARLSLHALRPRSAGRADEMAGMPAVLYLRPAVRGLQAAERREVLATSPTPHTRAASVVSSPVSRHPMLTIYNTLSRNKEVFTPIEPGKVRMYVCGMTVYDFCHLGHARVMVVFDMVARWLRASGLDVTYVRNITDIDDKIIRRAQENGETIRQLTDRFIAAMHEDADALGVLRPDHEPRATEYVAQMQSLISRLEQKGLAYVAANRDVCYAVRKFEGYG